MCGIAGKSLVSCVIIILSLCGASAVIAEDTLELKKALKTVEVTDPKILQKFQLLDQHNQPFGLERFSGKWTFVFFGYTSCPDVCPMTADELKSVYKKLDSRSDYVNNTQFLFVSVDPIRDTPETLNNFTGHFSFDLMGATAPLEVLNEFTDQLGVFHQRLILEDKSTKERQYAVEHDSSIYLINPKLEISAIFPSPHYSKELTQLYLVLREKYQP